MEHHLEQGAVKPFHGQQEYAQQHIGHLAEGGTGQTPFQLLFLIGQHGTGKYGHHSHGQQGVLHPCPPKERGTGHIVHHTDDSHHPCLGNQT